MVKDKVREKIETESLCNICLQWERSAYIPSFMNPLGFTSLSLQIYIFTPVKWETLGE